MGRAERAAGPRVRHRAQEVLTEKAVFAARLRDGRPTIRHTCPRPQSLNLIPQARRASKRIPPPHAKPIPGNRGCFHAGGKTAKMRGLCSTARAPPAISVALRVAMDAADDDPTPDATSSRPRSLGDYEREALARMSPEALGYIVGGAGDEVTLADNVAAWRRFALRPRMLVGASHCDPGVTVLAGAGGPPGTGA